MSEVYVWLIWSAGACGSYLVSWLLVYLLAGGIAEGDPVIKSLRAWSSVLFLHALVAAIFAASWLSTWFGLVRFIGMWGSPSPPMVGTILVCLAIDGLALYLVTRDRRAFELLTPRE